MRTAITTTPRTQSFQYGGQVGVPPGLWEPNPVQAGQASPQQPSPGASGVTPPIQPAPPVPLGGGEGVPTVAQRPPTAIQTGGPPVQVQAPAAQEPPDDIDIADFDNFEAQRWAQQGAPNGKFMTERPAPLTIKDHADFGS